MGDIKLVTRHVVDREGRGWYMVSVVGGPQDLLKRSTEAAALSDGAAYVAENWGRRSDGTWTPYPHEWAR